MLSFGSRVVEDVGGLEQVREEGKEGGAICAASQSQPFEWMGELVAGIL